MFVSQNNKNQQHMHWVNSSEKAAFIAPQKRAGSNDCTLITSNELRHAS
jgi:hypothetical protein